MSQTRWWGSQISEISVDVQDLDRQQRERLGVPGCCDGAVKPLLSCGACCLLGVIAPLALIVSSSEPGNKFLRDVSGFLGGLLLIGGFCSCCCGIRRTCCEGLFNVPDPAPLVPPLSQKAKRRQIAVRRVLLIYNPNAGKYQAEVVLRDAVIPGLRKRGVTCEAVATTAPGHARELGATVDLSPFQAVVTLGGDGTFHELVNGLLARQDGKRLPVTLIPLGSGNGLAATLRQNMRRRGEEVSIWSELNDVLGWSLDRVAGGLVSPVDLLELEVRGGRLVAVMQVYVGLLAEADVIAEPFRWLGPARLELVSVWNILRKRASELACTMKLANGEVQSSSMSAIGASIGLSQHFDDTMRAVPAAQLDDGLAELSIIPSEASVDQLLAGFLKIGQGAHTEDTIWDSKQVTEVELGFEGPGIFNVDGEILEHDGKVKIRVLPQSLEMLVGKEEWEGAAPAAQAAEVPEWRPDSQRWRMLGIFCFQSMANQAIWIGFAPIQKQAMESFHESAGWVNLLALSFMILYLPANFPASYAMDVHGCRFALLVGASINTLGAVLRCACPVGPGVSAWLVMAGQVLCALSQPFFTDMPPKIAGVWFPAYQRVLADTIASMAAPVGAAVGFLLPAVMSLQSMLYAQLAWSVAALLLIVGLFGRAPLTPPSPLSKRNHAMAFSAELASALQNGRLWCLLIAFACSLGSFNCLSTLAAELTRPFGFSEDDASSFGVLTVAFGIVGAAVMTTIVSYTHRYKPVLVACCLLCVAFSALAAAAIIQIGAGPGGMPLVSIGFAGLGFAATPIMPVAFEAAVEVGYPTGEGTLAGLCMSGGQVLGVAQTLLVSELVQRGQPEVAWILSGILFVFALIAVSLFVPKSGALHLLEEEFGSEHSSTLRAAASPLLAATELAA